MRRKLLNALKCPNCGYKRLKIFAFEAQRGDAIINNVDDMNLLDSDDVISGMCICESSNSIFVIEKSIGIFLADKDIDPKYLDNKLRLVESKIPSEYNKILSLHLKRTDKIEESRDSTWNFEEMQYYEAPHANLCTRTGSGSLPRQ